MSNRIVIVGEGITDFEAASVLIDQSLLRHVEYIEDETITAYRTYLGMSPVDSFVRWHTSPQERRQDTRRIVRRQWGTPITHPVELVVATKVFEIEGYFSDRGESQPYLVLVKDTDADEECRDALVALRERYAEEEIVIGIEHTELECWLVSAFVPQDDDERQRLRDMDGGELPGCGFNPCLRSHDLTATKADHDGIKLSPKRVLRYLTAGHRPRVMRDLHRDNHGTLVARGEHNGLADFLGDIRTRLIRVMFGV